MRKFLTPLLLAPAIAACAPVGETMASESLASSDSSSRLAADGGELASAEDGESGAVTASTFKDDWRRGDAARTFEYNWPREVNLEPELAVQLTDLRQEALDRQISE